MFHTFHARNYRVYQVVIACYSCAKPWPHASPRSPFLRPIARWLPMWPLNHLFSRRRRRNPWRTLPAEKHYPASCGGPKQTTSLLHKKNPWGKKLTPKKKNAFFWWFRRRFFWRVKLNCWKGGGCFNFTATYVPMYWSPKLRWYRLGWVKTNHII